MSGAHDAAEQAVKELYAELPIWMQDDWTDYFDKEKPSSVEIRKHGNVRRFRNNLQTVAEYLGVEV